MEITWLGHSCFKLRGRDASVVTDPPSKKTGYTIGRPTANVITISHEHSDGARFDPQQFRDEHLSDAEVERWNQSSPNDGFNVLANREALDALIAWMAREPLSRAPRCGSQLTAGSPMPLLAEPGRNEPRARRSRN